MVGVAWCGVVGGVRHGLVGVARCGVIRHNSVGVAWCGEAWFSWLVWKEMILDCYHGVYVDTFSYSAHCVFLTPGSFINYLSIIHQSIHYPSIIHPSFINHPSSIQH